MGIITINGDLLIMDLAGENARDESLGSINLEQFQQKGPGVIVLYASGPAAKDISAGNEGLIEEGEWYRLLLCFEPLDKSIDPKQITLKDLTGVSPKALVRVCRLLAKDDNIDNPKYDPTHKLFGLYDLYLNPDYKNPEGKYERVVPNTNQLREELSLLMNFEAAARKEQEESLIDVLLYVLLDQFGKRADNLKPDTIQYLFDQIAYSNYAISSTNLYIAKVVSDLADGHYHYFKDSFKGDDRHYNLDNNSIDLAFRWIYIKFLLNKNYKNFG